MSNVLLRAGRLVLRDHTLDDFAAYRRFWANQARDAPNGALQTAEEVWYRLGFFVGHWATLGYGLFLVIDPSTKEIVGEMGFRRMQRSLAPLTGEREGGWNLTREHRRQGLASEAMICARDWMDAHHPGVQTCFIDTDNTASLKLAEKLGFGAVSELEYDSSRVTLFERAASMAEPQTTGGLPSA